MGYQRLEISRLNESSTVTRHIVCLAGRISVFRARLDAELTLYADLLSGKPIRDRFSVILDGETFAAESRLLIGPQSSDFGPAGTKVADYLLQHGAVQGTLEKILLNGGLGGMSQIPCAGLNPEQQRLLQLVAACVTTEKVVVLDDPFAGLPEQWRKTMAVQLAEAAWNNQTIMIVVRLPIRPDSWIDNPYIARVQLERPRDKTIGFGAADFGLSDFNQLAPSPAATVGSARASQVIQQSGGKLTSGGKKQAYLILTERQALLGLSIACVTMFIMLMKGHPHPQQVRVAANTSPPAAAEAPGYAQPQQPATATIAEPAAPAPLAPAAATALDAYPDEIRAIVIKAFRDPKSLIKDIPNFPAKSAPPPAPAVAQPAQAGEPAVPLYEPATILDSASPDAELLEQQRQLLQQNFLEAVERARQRENAGGQTELEVFDE